MRFGPHALTALALVAACSLDWDRLDPSLGSAGMGGVGGVVGAGGQGGLAEGGASSSATGGAGTGGAGPEPGDIVCAFFTDGWFRALAAHPDGGFFVGGSFSDTLSLGGDPLISAGADDGLVARFGPDCEHVFSVRMGSADMWDGVEGLAVTPDGGVVAVGSFLGTADYGSFSLTSNGDQDAYVVMLGADGSFVWATSFGGIGAEWGRSVAVDDSGDVYLLGLFEDVVTVGSTTLTTNGGLDAMVVKLDGPSGTPIWATSYGSGSAERALRIAVDATGALVVVGRHRASMTFGSDAVPHVGERDAHVLEIGPTGQPSWIQAFASPMPMSAEYVQGLALRPDDRIVVVGRFDTTLDFGATTLTSAGGRDVFVAELDALGTPLWAKSFGGATDDRACGVALDASGNIGVVGSLEGEADLGAGPVGTAGEHSLFASVYDPIGAPLWGRVFAVGAGGYTRGLATVFTTNGDLVVAGTTDGIADFDGPAPDPGFVVRLSAGR